MPRIKHEIRDLKSKTQNDFRHIDQVKKQLSSQQEAKIAMMDKIHTTEASLERARYDNNQVVCEYRDLKIENQAELNSQNAKVEQLSQDLTSFKSEMETKLENKRQMIELTKDVCKQKEQELAVARKLLDQAKGNAHIVEEKRQCLAELEGET